MRAATALRPRLVRMKGWNDAMNCLAIVRDASPLPLWANALAMPDLRGDSLELIDAECAALISGS